jgi:hypothetical protein
MLLGAARQARAPVFRSYQRIDTDQVAAQIDERPATAARVNRRIRLDVNHGRLGLELPRHGTNHSQRNGVLKSERAA